MEPVTIIIIIAVLLLIYIVFLYNKIVHAKNMNKEAFSNVDVALKQRYDLIPNLLETVKGYANYEGDILEKIAQMRSNKLNIDKRSGQETDFTKDIKNILVIMEKYPDLKASEGFIKFQDNLVKIEETIENARRYYNGTTRNYNVIIQKFPNNIVSKLFGCKEAEYFEVELVTKQSPKIDL